MSDVAAIATIILLPVVSLFFWLRGIVRANMGDLVAGLAILLVVSASVLFVVGQSGAFNYVGCVLIVFGVATYVVSRFVKDTPLFKRRDLILSAVLFVVVGLCGLVII